MLVLILYLVGSFRLGRQYDVETADLTIPEDSASIARGAHLARTNGCTDCHGPALGGQVFADAPPFRVVASNLTSGEGGVADRYDARSLDRAIRHGIRYDGRPLFIMPSAAFHGLSDEDAADLIAYLQNLPSVDNVLPQTEFRTLGRIMSAFALDTEMEVRTGAARSVSPAPGPTAEYGEYLTSITCTYCHGADLRGSQPPNPDSPLAPDLARAGQWSFEELEQALRRGVTPSGATLNPEFMPWTFTATMMDEELRAIHAHLATLGGSGSAGAAGE